MLHLFIGSDRKKAREWMNAAIKKIAKKSDTLFVSDASALADIDVALQGEGMFGGRRVVVFDGIFGNDQMREKVLAALPQLRESGEYFVLEEKLDAATRKQIEKYAQDSKKFDAAKSAEAKTIFALANALRKGDRKALWVGYQRELLGSAPEAIHGVLFWAAKQMFMSARGNSEKEKAERFIAKLAELPHESRRKGVELEYALEKFVLSVA